MRNRVPTSLPATNAKHLRKGAAATKQSILSFPAAQWLASLALAMTMWGCIHGSLKIE
jgi:hypothetical protein